MREKQIKNLYKMNTKTTNEELVNNSNQPQTQVKKVNIKQLN